MTPFNKSICPKYKFYKYKTINISNSLFLIKSGIFCININHIFLHKITYQKTMKEIIEWTTNEII